jgi:hypothetical protein
MRHAHAAIAVLGSSLLVGLAACNKEQRASADSAAGAVATDVRSALSVIDIDMGRHIDAEKKIVDKTDDFTAADTIYASVHTSGTAKSSPITARWTFQDGALVDETTQSVTTDGTAYTEFHIAKPGGFPRGTYTLHLLVDGKEVRTKKASVK